MTATLRFIQTKPRNERGEVEYEVWRVSRTEYAVQLGTVERYAWASYRKHGRLRGSLIGHSRHWRAYVTHAEARRHWGEATNAAISAGAFKLEVIKAGIPPNWRLYLGSRSVGSNTRREAVERLVAWYDHPELREAPGAD